MLIDLVEDPHGRDTSPHELDNSNVKELYLVSISKNLDNFIPSIQ